MRRNKKYDISATEKEIYIKTEIGLNSLKLKNHYKVYISAFR